MSTRTVWYWDAPTIQYCTVHESTDFAYTPGEGLRCLNRLADKTCDESCWVEFEASPSVYDAADEAGVKLNEPEAEPEDDEDDELEAVALIYSASGEAGVLKYMAEKHPAAHKRYCEPCEEIYPILFGACSVCGTATEIDPHGYTDDIAGEPQLDEDGNVIHRPTTCGTCNRTWNDAVISSTTPVPSARCPFEYEHDLPVDHPSGLGYVGDYDKDAPETVEVLSGQAALDAGHTTDMTHEESTK